MSKAVKYRKKPVVIEAMQMPLDSRPGDPTTDDFHVVSSEMARQVRDIALWMVENGYDANPDGEDIEDWDEQYLIKNSDGSLTALPEYGTNYLEIVTLEGEMYASPGDFIIRGVQGEFYPCKPDIFKATYEAAPNA